MTYAYVNVASLKTLYEKPKGKNSYKEKSAIWYLQQVINHRDSHPDTSKPQSKFIPIHSTHKKCGVW